MTNTTNSIEAYRTQHKLRLSYMPWLYWSLKAKHRSWANAWQYEWQQYLQSIETVTIGENCFVAPEAKIFAEPGRPIIIGDNSFIAADCVLHGPITVGHHVSINHHCTLEGGRAGIHIGDHTRIACYSKLFAFNHGQQTHKPISEQGITSKGISIEKDVWIGADVKIVDGVTIGEQAVVGMGSVVTKNVANNDKVGGNPAVNIGHRA